MRKFSYKAPDSQETIVTTPHLSLEEEAILQDDQNVLLNQAETDGQEIDRLVDTESSIQDTILIVDQTPEFGTVDQGLVNAVADVAAAGTDADPEQVIPTTAEGIATEDFVADTIARVKEMWKKIKEYLMNAWKALVEYMTGEKKQLEGIKAKAESVEKLIQDNQTALNLEPEPAAASDTSAEDAAKLEAAKAQMAAERKARREKALAELQSKLQHHQFQFKGDASLISTTSGVPKDFEKEVVQLASYSQQTHKTIATTLRDLCHAYDEVLTKFESDKPQAAIPGFVDRFHKDLERLGNTIGGSSNTDGLLRWHTKAALLGQFDVELTDQQAGDSVARSLSTAARAQLSISSGTAKQSGEVPLLAEFNTPATAAVIKRWVDFKLSHDGMGMEEDLWKMAEKFLDKIDRLVNVQASVKGVSDDNDSYHLIQGLINMCRCLYKLVSDFTTKFAAPVQRIMQSALSYQEQSIKERIRLYHEAGTAS